VVSIVRHGSHNLHWNSRQREKSLLQGTLLQFACAVSLDLLKTRHREARLLQLCLETQQPFVIDNTNATIADRARYIPPAKEKGYRVTGYFFEVNDAFKRNEQRQGSERIPKPGIFATLKRLQRPSLAEGFDELFLIKPCPDGFQISPLASQDDSLQSQ
jgi:hypothetical protein